MRDWTVPVTNTFQRERKRDHGTLPVRTPHPSITFLALAIQPSALLQLFRVHGVYRACSWTTARVMFPLCCQLL
jgi:hypothetical protein